MEKPCPQKPGIDPSVLVNDHRSAGPCPVWAKDRREDRVSPKTSSVRAFRSAFRTPSRTWIRRLWARSRLLATASSRRAAQSALQSIPKDAPRGTEERVRLAAAIFCETLTNGQGSMRIHNSTMRLEPCHCAFFIGASMFSNVTIAFIGSGSMADRP